MKDEQVKSVVYNATTSQQIFAIRSSGDLGATTTEAMPRKVEIQNMGESNVFLMVGYSSYTTDTAFDAVDYLHVLLPAGATYEPPIRAVISSAADKTIMFGTPIDNDAPSSFNSGLLWYDSTANLAAHVRPDTNPLTITVGSDETNLFRVGDLIQIGRGTSQTDITEATYYREILKVQSITDGEDMVCERALYGTDAGDYDETNWSAGHAIGQPIYFPFFNAYHDVDKYSVAQTDANGQFMTPNLFGYGRAASGVQGINPGSVAVKFNASGYQELGMSGVNPSTNTGLTASTTYAINITVDGGTEFADLSFITDSSNVNFGGVNGVLSKIQSAIDTQYYTAGNLFEKVFTVSITGGDVRFTSGSHLSTSAISLANCTGGSSETNFFGAGRIPAIGNVDAAIDAKLPDDVVYDRITGVTSAANVSAYDDGYGNFHGACSGSINYDTGFMTLNGAPANAEFVITASYNSVFSGKLTSDTANETNALVEVLANNFCQKAEGKVNVRVS